MSNASSPALIDADPAAFLAPDAVVRSDHPEVIALARELRAGATGAVAVHLGGRWHRQDPRGNKAGVDAQFSLDDEQLAWEVDTSLGERDYATLFAAPAASVVEVLSTADDVLALDSGGLPTSLACE